MLPMFLNESKFPHCCIVMLLVLKLWFFRLKLLALTVCRTNSSIVQTATSRVWLLLCFQLVHPPKDLILHTPVLQMEKTICCFTLGCFSQDHFHETLLILLPRFIIKAHLRTSHLPISEESYASECSHSQGRNLVYFICICPPLGVLDPWAH